MLDPPLGDRYDSAEDHWPMDGRKAPKLLLSVVSESLGKGAQQISAQHETAWTTPNDPSWTSDDDRIDILVEASMYDVKMRDENPERSASFREDADMPEIEAFELTCGNVACSGSFLKPRSIEMVILHFPCAANLPERHANTLNGFENSFVETSTVLHQFHRRSRSVRQYPSSSLTLSVRRTRASGTFLSRTGGSVYHHHSR